jgi:hypothetical protein
VIESAILTDQDDDVLDRCAGRVLVIFVLVAMVMVFIVGDGGGGVESQRRSKRE